MMDKTHVGSVKPRLLAEDFVLEAPKRSLPHASAVGRLFSAVFIALAAIWVLWHGGFQQVTEIFR